MAAPCPETLARGNPDLFTASYPPHQSAVVTLVALLAESRHESLAEFHGRTNPVGTTFPLSLGSAIPCGAGDGDAASTCHFNRPVRKHKRLRSVIREEGAADDKHGATV